LAEQFCQAAELLDGLIELLCQMGRQPDGLVEWLDGLAA